MRARLLVRMILLAVFAGGLFSEMERLAAAQGQESAASKPSAPSDSKKSTANAQLPLTAGSLEEILNRMIDREHAEIEAISQYSPIIETYIQQVRPNKELGMVPQSDFYFLSQADFRARLKVHSLIDSSRKGYFMWSFDPAGFLQMIFIDRGEFDKVHYRFKHVRREFLGDVRCYVFDVSPAPKTRGARFVGRVWVEDQDYTIVRISGNYTPAIHFSWKTFEDQYYLHFDSWRNNVKSGMWLPSYIYSQELNRPARFGNPLYKSSTHLWGYKLTTASREEELSRLLIESPNPIKEEAAQHDRSPLEAQRAWRHEAENNVLDLLERDVPPRSRRSRRWSFKHHRQEPGDHQQPR